VTNIAKSKPKSGQWAGFLNSRTESSLRFDVLLEFSSNSVTGVGNDENGMFVLSGEYEHSVKEFRWVQTYPFGTTVFYRGFWENGCIWGTWQSDDGHHGGFEIRPNPEYRPNPNRPVQGVAIRSVR
jgi:hypothetical protein